MNDLLSKKVAQSIEANRKWNDFIEQFNMDVQVSGYISNATFELTAFCTLKCPMCYVRINQEQANNLGGRPRTTKEWIELARQFRNQGGVFLLLTGGEAMSRPDFCEIYDEISRMGLFVTLFTNGTTVNEQMLSLLKKRPPSMIGITIYGSSEETYQRFGGSEGSFQRAIEGLDRLLTIPNIAIDVRFTACRENYKDYEDVFQMALDRGKYLTLDYGTCAPVRGACSDARKLRLNAEEMSEITAISRKMSKAITDKYKDSINETRDLHKKLTKSTDIEDARQYWCRGGKNSVYVAWDGRMYACDMAPYPFAFPFEQGFLEAARDIRHQIDNLILPKRCTTCKNNDSYCSCIPKALNEMQDCARKGEHCNYQPMEVHYNLGE